MCSLIKFLFLFRAQVDDSAAIGVEKINTILESFMGIYDTELGGYSK